MGGRKNEDPPRSVGSVPNANRNVNRRNSTDRGNLSPRSYTAKIKLDTYEQRLDAFKGTLHEFSQRLGSGTFSHDDLTHMKNELAQLNGTLEKLQFNEIDSIVTADLNTGKLQVKAKRKGLNSECEKVRENIKEVNSIISALISDGR